VYGYYYLTLLDTDHDSKQLSLGRVLLWTFPLICIKLLCYDLKTILFTIFSRLNLHTPSTI